MTERKHYYSLDLLKFLLAIVIVFHHFQQYTSTKFPNFNFFFGRIYFGYTVEFFFIISGFVAAAGLKDKMPVFKTYALNKAIRIYPMVWASILFTIVISIFYRFILGSFPEYGFPPKGKRGLWHTVNSFLLTYAGGGTNLDTGINGVTWYLCVLLLCYVWLYLTTKVSERFDFNPRYGFLLLCIIGTTAMSYGFDFPFLNASSARGYSAFFLGMMLFYLNKTASKRYMLPLSVFSLFISVFSVLIVGCDNQWAIFTFILFPSVLYICLNIEETLTFSAGTSRIAKLLGWLSFDIYLFHLGFIHLFILLKKLQCEKPVFTRIEMILFAVFMCIAGGIIYCFIELPVTKFLKSRLRAKLSS